MSRKAITEVDFNTRVTNTSVMVRWTIENFSRLDPTVGQSIRTSEFSADEDSKTKWWLELYPNGNCEQSKGYISLFLNCKINCKEVTVTFALIDDQNNEKFKQRLNRGFFGTSRAWGFGKYVSRDVLSNERVLVADRLTIECQISYDTKVVTSVGSPKSKFRKVDEREVLIKGLDQLYESSKDYDIILEVDGKEFRAHKTILRARSPVFDAMFDHSFKESIESRVKIEDIGKDVFEAVLKFIYTAKIGRKDIDFKQLLFAADKYDLKDLKVICEEEIASKLSVDTVCDSLLLADRHSSPELKEIAVQFFRTNKKAVMATKGYKELAKNPALLSYVFERL